MQLLCCVFKSMLTYELVFETSGAQGLTAGTTALW